MKIGILGSPRGWHVQALRRTMERRGIAVTCLPITRLVARIAPPRSLPTLGGKMPWVRSQEESLDDYDALFVRAIPGGSLEQIIFRVDALHRLENVGVRIVNPPTTIERTVDKYYTSSLLEDAGLPTPRTVVTERFDEAMVAFREIGDVVVKPLFGSEGRGMVRVCDEDIAYRVFRALELGRYVYYLQEFIPHANEDIRAFVIGDQVVAAMIRRSDSWKTNVAQGAEAEPLALSAELEEMSLRAARALDADYAGVDILRSERGEVYVTEVNGIPGWAKLRQVTGVDVAELLVEYVIG